MESIGRIGVPMTVLDWPIIGIFFVIVIGIGVWQSRQAGKSSTDFFLGSRGMPWWLLAEVYRGDRLINEQSGNSYPARENKS